MMKKYLDIGSNCGIDFVEELSNFTAVTFYVDDIKCNSMEGFLQSLKFSDLEKQIEVCKLIGVQAKFKGKKKKWYKDQLLYWKGQVIDRHSDEYQKLLDKAFSAISMNDEYKVRLKKTNGYILTHDIGKTNPKQTILTVDEFCNRLMKLRDYSILG